MSDLNPVIVCPACDLLIERKLLPLRRHAHCPAVTSICTGAMHFVPPN